MLLLVIIVSYLRRCPWGSPDIIRFSSHLRGLEPLPYTPYVEECCQALVDAKQYPDDNYLVQLVRIQRVVNIIRQHVLDDQYKLRAPFGMHIASIQSELNSVKQSWGDVRNRSMSAPILWMRTTLTV